MKKINTNRLYIVGNGFDLNHGLSTRYADFNKFVTENRWDLEHLFEEYFRLKRDKSQWSDFENDLGTFDWKSFFKDSNHIDVLNDNFRQSFTYRLEDALRQETEALVTDIKEAFWDWLDEMAMEGIDKKMYLDRESIFLTFNYTLTLERLYEIPVDRILHIHGDVENNPGNLIFGHSIDLIEAPESHKNWDSNITLFSDAEAASKFPFYALYKPVRSILGRNRIFFTSLGQIEKIIILGHSLNPADIPYFMQIKRQTPNAKWQVSYYTERDKETHLKTLFKMGVNRRMIRQFRMDEF